LEEKKNTKWLNPCPAGCTHWLCRLLKPFCPGAAIMNGLVGLRLFIKIQLFHRDAVTTARQHLAVVLGWWRAFWEADPPTERRSAGGREMDVMEMSPKPQE